MESQHIIRSGIPALDEVVQGYRLGDNVVWQVDNLEDYIYFVKPFAEQAVRDKRRCIYFRFAPHPPVIGPDSGFEIIEADPGPGFDPFSGAVHRIIKGQKRCEELAQRHLHPSRPSEALCLRR